MTRLAIADHTKLERKEWSTKRKEFVAKERVAARAEAKAKAGADTVASRAEVVRLASLAALLADVDLFMSDEATLSGLVGGFGLDNNVMQLHTLGH